MGQLVIILGLLLSVWAAVKDKPFFKKIFVVSCLTVGVGIVLTFGDRLEEVTVENVCSIKTAVIKAHREANQIASIRKRIEAQAHKVDLVAKEAKSALKRIRNVQNILDSMKVYGKLAKINFYGEIPQGGGISTSSPLSGWTGGFVGLRKVGDSPEYQVTGDRMCSHAALIRYKTITNKYPFWPFAHFVLAVCLKQKGDKAWKEHALKALEILEKTAEVPDHHPDHSIILSGVKRLLGT